MNPINWLHTYEPSPILASLGPINIYWYGLFYFATISLSLVWARQLLGKLMAGGENISLSAKKLLENLPDFAFGLVVAGLIGARLYHVAIEWPYYQIFPSEIVAIWHGGLAIHGALIGGAIFLWGYAKYLSRHLQSQSISKTFLWLADFTTPFLLLGQVLGRWGNYFNQELFGQPTNLAWGIPISPDKRPAQFANAPYFHPTFLYESIWNLIGLVIMYILFFRRLDRRPGRVLSFYLIWTGVGRILTEALRTDATATISDFRLPVLVATGFILVGLGILLSTTNKITKEL